MEILIQYYWIINEFDDELQSDLGINFGLFFLNYWFFYWWIMSVWSNPVLILADWGDFERGMAAAILRLGGNFHRHFCLAIRRIC